MKAHSTSIGWLIVILALLFLVADVTAQPGGRHGRGIFSQLTEEQRTELKAKVEELRQSGASQEEIRTAVHELFQQWGIKVEGRGGFWSKLNDQQKTELQEMIAAMRSEGKDRTEIRNAMMEKLKSWGIEFNPGDGRHGRGGFWSKLNDQQKTELQNMISTMRAEGKERDEIHDAVMEKLKSWGIEFNPGDGRHGRGKFWSQLNDEQKAELKEMVTSMRTDGKDRKEIHAAVVEKLKSWGITLGKGKGGAPTPGITESTVIGLRNYPNPFNPSTTISYSLQTSSPVVIQVFGAKGELVRELKNEQQAAGTHSITWDGTNSSGKKVASGTYTLVVNAGSQSQTIQMILAK